MGLTESNQSKSSFWGPSKSKSTHFPEGVYEGKPRQAVTLPSRPITRNVNNNAISTDDSALSIINSRPPDIIKYKDHALYVSAKELYTFPHNVQYSNQSEQLINFSSPSWKLSPSSKKIESPLLNDGLYIYSQPYNGSQNIYLKKASLSEASLINETTENYEYVSKRVRSRSHNYRKRDSSSCSRKTYHNGIASEEKETQTFPQSPLLRNDYDCKSERHVIHTQRRSISFKDNKSGSVHRSRKSGRKIAEKVSCSVPTTPNEIVSDPYICLHYGNNLDENSSKVNEHLNRAVTTKSPVYSEACLYIPKNNEITNVTAEPKLPKRKKSQIIIQLDNRNTNHVDNLDLTKINRGTYEVCSNVWFESSVNVDKKNFMKNKNTVVNLNEVPHNDSFKNERVQPLAGDYCYKTNALACRSELNRNDVAKCIPDSNLQEKYAKNTKLMDTSTKMQPFNSKQCLILSDNVTHEGETFFSKSENEINYNTEQLNGKKENDLMLENAYANICNKENYVESHEENEFRLSPSHEIENSLKILPLECIDVSVYEAIPQMDIRMQNEFSGKIYDCTDDFHVKKEMSEGIKNFRDLEHRPILHATSKTNEGNCPLPEYKSATLPSDSKSLSNVIHEYVLHDDGFRGRNVLYDGFQGANTNTSCNIMNGTFPVLRLPKPASQPRLVDVLRKENGKYQHENNSVVIKRSSSDTSFIDIRNRSQKCTLSTNNLNITKDAEIKFKEENTIKTNIEHDEVENIIKAPKNHKPSAQERQELKDVEHRINSNENGSSIKYCNLPRSESDKRKQCNGRLFDYKNKTIPVKKDVTYREKIRNFFSLKLKHVEKMDSNIDCSLMCHEQCQGVVSLDCKMDSPDTDLQFHDAKPHLEGEDVPIVDFFPLEDNENPVPPKELNEEVDDGKEDVEVETNIEEGEEEKHEEEMLEKEIIIEQEILSQKKQEVSTLRRTVRRIQSQAVDSAKIEEWVQKCPAANVGLQITKEEDGGYRGCLRIHLNLNRPINIVTGTRPPSIYDILQEERTLEKTLTSFYMPRDIVKAIHITSKTTTREVIVALLRKFKVVDNPQKFALYERTYDTGQSIKAKLRRLSDNECPLVLAIAWNAQNITNKRLVLQENDTADIQWEAFSLPELDNFLRILDREEGEYKNQIRDKYSLLRHRIQLQLSRMNT